MVDVCSDSLHFPFPAVDFMEFTPFLLWLLDRIRFTEGTVITS